MLDRIYESDLRIGFTNRWCVRVNKIHGLSDIPSKHENDKEFVAIHD